MTALNIHAIAFGFGVIVLPVPASEDETDSRPPKTAVPRAPKWIGMPDGRDRSGAGHKQLAPKSVAWVNCTVPTGW